ncbi:MAG: hypothetical protein SFU25_04670, partial [Candidatus Caenarcaniphilales bacterium]|nr:hypothetical protein [Candidatus Caenarcaniphilales bacterium]
AQLLHQTVEHANSAGYLNQKYTDNWHWHEEVLAQLLDIRSQEAFVLPSQTETFQKIRKIVDLFQEHLSRDPNSGLESAFGSLYPQTPNIENINVDYLVREIEQKILSEQQTNQALNDNRTSAYEPWNPNSQWYQPSYNNGLGGYGSPGLGGFNNPLDPFNNSGF